MRYIVDKALWGLMVPCLEISQFELLGADCTYLTLTTLTFFSASSRASILVKWSRLALDRL